MKKCVSLLILTVFCCNLPLAASAYEAMLPVQSNNSGNYAPPPVPANIHYVAPWMYNVHSTGTHRKCTSTIRNCPVANSGRHYTRNYYSENNYYQTNNYYY